MAGPKIIQRGPQSFTVPVSLGLDPLTKKRRRVWLSGKTRAKVHADYVDLMAQLQRGPYVPFAKEPLGSYLKHWVELGDARWAPSTTYGYRKVVRRVDAAPLGTIPLRDLTVEHLEAYYKAKIEAGLSPNAIRNHHKVIRAALSRARKLRKIGDNPASLVELPAITPFEPTTFDPEQLRLFLGEAKRTSPFYPLYLMAVTTGLRLSELLGARWSDLGKDGVYQVRQAFVRVPKVSIGRAFKGPKSKKSRRPIVVPDAVLEILQQVHAEQQQHRALLGKAYHDYDLIFCQANGNPHHASNIVRRDLKPLLKRAGLPLSFRFHDQRGSHLSHLDRVGTPASVTQQRAGHSDISITFGSYVRSKVDQQRDVARQVAEDLGLRS
jgi:integrase